MIPAEEKKKIGKTGGKGEVLVFSPSRFRKPKKWISALMALIFLFTSLCPAQAARSGNYGDYSSGDMFLLGFIAGAITDICIMFGNPYAGVAGSVCANIASVYMYYNHYQSSGETVCSFTIFGTEVNISRQAFWSMVAGVVGGIAGGWISGLSAGASGASSGAKSGATAGFWAGLKQAIQQVIEQSILDTIKQLINRIIELIKALVEKFIRTIIQKWWAAYLETKFGIKKMWAEAATSIASMVLGFIVPQGSRAELGKDEKGNDVLVLKDSNGKTTDEIKGKAETDGKGNVSFKAADGRTYDVKTDANGNVNAAVRNLGFTGKVMAVVSLVTCGAGVSTLLNKAFGALATWVNGGKMHFTAGGMLRSESQITQEKNAFKNEVQIKGENKELDKLDGKEVTKGLNEKGEVVYRTTVAKLAQAVKNGDVSSKTLNAALSKEDLVAIRQATWMQQAIGGIPMDKLGRVLQDLSWDKAMLGELANAGYAGALRTVATTALLDVLGYDEYRGSNKKKLYSDLVKMVIAQTGGSIVTRGAVGLDTGNWSGTATGMVKDASVGLARLGFAALWRNSDAHPAFQGLGDMAISSVVSAGVDAVARRKGDTAQVDGVVKYENKKTGEEAVYQKVDNEDYYVRIDKEEHATPTVEGLSQMYDKDKGWEAKPYTYEKDKEPLSVGTFAGAVARDFNGSFKRAALETAISAAPYDSTGNEPDAVQKWQENQDKFIKAAEGGAKGVVGTMAVVNRMGSEFNKAAADNFGNSLGYAIANTWLPDNEKQYVKFAPQDARQQPQFKAIKRETETKLAETENKIKEVSDKLEKFKDLDKDAEAPSITEILLPDVFQQPEKEPANYVERLPQQQVDELNIEKQKLEAERKSLNKDLATLERGAKVSNNWLSYIPVIGGMSWINGGIVDYKESRGQDGYTTRINSSSGFYLSEDRFDPQANKIASTELDSFGRRVRTEYYDEKGNTLNKATDHYYGPFDDHILFVTKDNAPSQELVNAKPLGKVEVEKTDRKTTYTLNLPEKSEINTRRGISKAVSSDNENDKIALIEVNVPEVREKMQADGEFQKAFKEVIRCNKSPNLDSALDPVVLYVLYDELSSQGVSEDEKIQKLNSYVTQYPDYVYSTNLNNDVPVKGNLTFKDVGGVPVPVRVDDPCANGGCKKSHDTLEAKNDAILIPYKEETVTTTTKETVELQGPPTPVYADSKTIYGVSFANTYFGPDSRTVVIDKYSKSEGEHNVTAFSQDRNELTAVANYGQEKTVYTRNPDGTMATTTKLEYAGETNRDLFKIKREPGGVIKNNMSNKIEQPHATQRDNFIYDGDRDDNSVNVPAVQKPEPVKQETIASTQPITQTLLPSILGGIAEPAPANYVEIR
jgi:hypothetical protein